MSGFDLKDFIEKGRFVPLETEIDIGRRRKHKTARLESSEEQTSCSHAHRNDFLSVPMINSCRKISEIFYSNHGSYG